MNEAVGSPLPISSPLRFRSIGSNKRFCLYNRDRTISVRVTKQNPVMEVQSTYLSYITLRVLDEPGSEGKQNLLSLSC
jgi:hypothetical protein